MAETVGIKTFDRNQLGLGYRYRFAFLGDPGTGKTSIMQQFVNRIPPKDEGPTLAVDYAERSVYLTEGPPVKLMFWDTPGDVRARSGTCNHCHRMSGVFFVYDPTVRESYLHIPRWHEQVDEKLGPDCFKYLVASKADIVRRNPNKSVVPVDEAQECATSLGMEFREVNGTDLSSVDSLLEPIITEIHAYNATGTMDWDREHKAEARVKANKKNQIREKIFPGGCCPWLRCRKM